MSLQAARICVMMCAGACQPVSAAFMVRELAHRFPRRVVRRALEQLHQHRYLHRLLGTRLYRVADLRTAVAIATRAPARTGARYPQARRIHSAPSLARQRHRVSPPRLARTRLWATWPRPTYPHFGPAQYIAHETPVWMIAP